MKLRKLNLAPVTRALGKVKLKAIQKAPLGLQIVGTVCVIAGVVVAIGATMEHKDDLESIAEDIEKVAEDEEGELITAEEARKKRWQYRKEYAFMLAHTYGKAAGLIAGGLGSFYVSYYISAKRIAGLGMALASKTAAMNLLEENIKAEYGEEILNKLKYGLHEDGVEAVDESNGVEIAYTDRIDQVPELKDFSRYAKIFDEDNPFWQNDRLQMMNMFQNWENVLNHELRRDHFMFLNHAYKCLRLPQSVDGCSAGWIFDQDNDKIDSYIKLKYQEVKIPSIKYKKGYKRAYIIDFNVDGSIVSKFEKHQTVI